MQWGLEGEHEEGYSGRNIPPDSSTVVRRSMCLAAIVRRGVIEEGIVAEGDLGPRGFVNASAEVGVWLVKQGLTEDLTSYERKVLSVPVGDWPRRYMIDANWRVEALAVLLWALSQIDGLPGYDTMVDPEEILNRSGLMKSVLDFGMSVRLRKYDTLIVQREIAEIWKWRVNTGRLIREGKLSRAAINIDDIIGQAAEELYEIYNAVLPVDGDIVAFGRPVRELDDEEFNVVGSIAVERSMALDWLCGHIDHWNGDGP